MKREEQIKILIADTSFIVRKGLKTLAEEHKKFAYAGEASDEKTLQQLLSEKEKVDVLIIEHAREGCFSVGAIERIRKEYPRLKILVISRERSAEEIKKVLNTGIRNYLLKDCDEKEITDAVISCFRGQKYFCGQIVDILIERELSMQAHCMTGSISDKETEVIRHLVSGKRPKEVAALMNLSYHTIVTHKRNIYSKLGINSAIELARYAAKTGLMSN